MLYRGVVGSYSHGIELPRSDIDICEIDAQSLNREKAFSNGEDIYKWGVSSLLGIVNADNPPWYTYQILFPEKILEETPFSQYIEQNRNRIIRAKHPTVYKTLFERAKDLEYFADVCYELHPKRMTYSTLLYSLLANYASGMSFAQAHRPEGELHDFLIAMRLGQVPLEDAVARNTLERQRAERAEDFYKDAVRPEVLREFEQVLLEEAGLK